MIVPDFLVIGAYKSGTTALHHQLRAHPALFLPERKEPSYFAFAAEGPPTAHPAAATSVRDRAAYDSLFAGAPQGALLGEVSPAYLAVPGTCERLRAEAPAARLIAVLRNPIERAYSDFLMYRRDGLEREPSFLAALDQQAARDPATDPTSRYVATGFYAAQLEPYVRAFPSEQLHVLLHDDLRDDPEATLRRLFEFLGVDPTRAVDPIPEVNLSGEPTSAVVRLAYVARRRTGRLLRPLVSERVKRRADGILQRGLVRPPIPAEARARLIDTYEADVTQPAALLGRDLGHWLRL